VVNEHADRADEANTLNAARSNKFIFQRFPKQWLALIALLVIGLIMLEKSPTVTIEPLRADPTRFPYAFMTEIETIEYDPTGKLRYKLNTPAARYFQADPMQPGPQDYTIIDQPRIVIFSANDTAPWHLSAERGQSDANGQQVRLTTDVRAEQDSARHGLMSVTTSELLINPALQYAETDKPVNMRAQQSHIETIGMRAYLSEDRIELLSSVRGSYAP
jgi:lipopolysaccharide export system protein LptC